MQSTRRVVLALILVTAGDALRAGEPSPEFTPRRGFGGRSKGNGALRLLCSPPRLYHVESFGFVRGDGAFQLNQTVAFRGRRPRNWHWVIRTVGPRHYAGTLSDAAGTVTGYHAGTRLFLRYRLAGPLVMHQTLTLRPDGRTIDNVGCITFLGLPIGRLGETILRKE